MRTLFTALAVAGLCVAQQKPHIENAKLEEHALSGSLAAQLAQFGKGPFWAAYSEPTIPGRHGNMREAGSGVLRLEGQTAVVVLIRMENSQVDQLRVTSPDCLLDAGGLPFYWLTGVSAAESVGWLKQRVTGAHPDPALLAIALHDGPVAEQALDQFTGPSQPESIREKAAFWLGNSRGAHGFSVLKKMLAADPSEKVREQVVFAMTQSKEAEAIPTLLDLAKNDKDARIRNRALFWIAQKAGAKLALGAIGSAIQDDPDGAVKEKAVFALTQLPNGEGVPMLIHVAKENPNPAVRKRAMFWLGESKDPRAVEFFAQVLAVH